MPFTYETKKSGIGRQEKHSRVWYERKLSLEKKEEKRYLLHFEGCDFYTKVWVNGELAGSHTGGYARFTFDVTELLIPGENRITVMAEDSYEIRQPRGKQRWRKENFGCWYVQTTGIWKTVWLEEVPELYISGLKITPLLKERAVEIDWEVGGDLEKLLEEGQKVFLNLEVGFQGRNISAVKIPVSRTHGRTRLDVFCDQEDFGEWGILEWKPGEPNLYDLDCTLESGDDKDSVMSYFGMREIAIEGQNILLNGRPLYQRLILDQGYWEDSHLTPPAKMLWWKTSTRSWLWDTTGLRKHQKIEDERFLYWCDKKGVLVWSGDGIGL